VALADDGRLSQTEEIDRVARKAANVTARRAARAYFALLFVLLVGAFFYSHYQEVRLHDGLMATCGRVNRLRVEESNRNAQVFYAAFYAARERERGLAAKGGPGAALHRKSVHYLDTSIAALRWTPATDCAHAVDRARGYRPPASRPFTRRFLDLRVVPR
jgi:hypothetical protein